MPVTLGSPPQHSFEQPLGLLSDCHRRIESFLSILHQVARQAAGRGLSEQERRAVQAALEYFRSAAPRHTADEEQSLFPLLRACERQDVQAALQTMAALESEHALADRGHAEVEFWFGRWLELGALAAPQTRALSRTLDHLQQLYKRHIAVEDHELFPLAREVLSGEQLKQLGAQMAQRRGLPPGRP